MDLRNPFPDDENTDLTPRVVLAQRRANLVWLVGAIGALVAAGGVSFVAQSSDRTTPVAVEIEAERIASAIDLSAKSAHVQADGVAMTPMVRAALETDAATMNDVAKNEIHLALNPGETLEVFQVRGQSATTLLRWPASATPLRPVPGHGTRLENSGKSSLDVVAGAPIEPQGQRKAEVGGEVAMSIPVDLALTRQHLSALVVEASLVGIGEPLALVAPRASGGATTQVSFPVQPSTDWKLPTMQLTVELASRRPRWITPTRYACVALSGMMLLLFVFGLRRH
ncbi:MAG TPA: hypothetical protein VLM79_40765 [Kofleriaceae bacterium]|nr:hypothetical protein [Kofleriaceae bacterium]